MIIQFLLKLLDAVSIIRHKWTTLAVIFLISLGLSFYYLYPKTSIIFLIYSDYLDQDGNLIPELKEDSLYKIQEKLAEKGIKLIFKAQTGELDHQVSLDDFFFKNPQSYDVTEIENFKEDIPKALNSSFKSLGVISRYPILFLEKSDRSHIRLLKDLNRKKITYSASPEEGNRSFMLSEVLRLSGADLKSKNIINIWPNKLMMNADWDILYTNYYPYDWATINPELYQSFLKGKIRFVNFEDAEALPINITTLELKDIPKSSYETSYGLPSENIRIPMVTTSVIVNASLDPSLVLILSEVLKDIYGKPDLFLAKKGEFPYFSDVEYFEPHPIARKIYKEGNQSLLAKYFPPTFAAFLEKLIFYFFETTTRAGRITLSASLYPFWNTVTTVLGFASGASITAIASCCWGSNTSPIGSNCVNSNFKNAS